MTLGIPQLIFLALIILEFGIVIARHGEPRRFPYNGWTQLVSILIVLGLLYWGGFFTGTI